MPAYNENEYLKETATALTVEAGGRKFIVQGHEVIKRDEGTTGMGCLPILLIFLSHPYSQQFQ